MKNLAWAGAGLAVIIILVFFFSSNTNNSDDTFIPSPVPLESTKESNLTKQETVMGEQNKSYSEPPKVLDSSEIQGKTVTLETEKGNIVIELYDDAPKASSNFTDLVYSLDSGKGCLYRPLWKQATLKRPAQPNLCRYDRKRGPFHRENTSITR